MIKDILIVGAGSFIGGAARYIVSVLMRFAGDGFPWATFVVNIVGSLFIGILWGITARSANMPSWFSLFLMTGFCGGFTTFSTFSRESFALIQSEHYFSFALYAVGSVLLGLSAVVLGYYSLSLWEKTTVC